MRASVLVSSLVAALVGFGGTLALILAAATAIGATPDESSSLVVALCLGVAATSAVLSLRYRMPIVTAWSTPGAALIASFGGGIGMPAASGAFLVAAALVLACAAARPLSDLVARLPMSVASAMLAGVLVRFVMALAENAVLVPGVVLPMLVLFLVVRLWSPTAAVLCVLVAGVAAIFGLGLADLGAVRFVAPRIVLNAPTFDASVMFGLGVPLFLVTMAAQNLPGLAVLRASGYRPPTAPALAATGTASLLLAPFGATGINLAAITAAICTGPDAHPDPEKRYLCGPVYALWYVALAALGASLVAVFAALPPAFIATVAGLALLAPLAGALAGALHVEKDRIAAVATFATTASGVSVLGIGAPFWGLAAGLAVLALDQVRGRFATMKPHG
ncbi:benzoate/H(+) symporter BenE family transporter [Aquabacter spiritensis]|uniref:Benzoate membrane transport protein n=1 Tax=Aquabacter spiritensis TaxID=933073 RepID=A0A4R3LY04_9HYPH|nr:benzoate/H(+) symporter BenE family transporter [Aquabacter spiritensis]TCT05096.1 benzoate membrane transport protein [Aquabacter spiritensis]